jgi:hypothetical protein
VLVDLVDEENDEVQSNNTEKQCASEEEGEKEHPEKPERHWDLNDDDEQASPGTSSPLPAV